MSLFNTLRRALGVNSGDNLEDETQISSFDQAGLTGDETTGAVAGTTNVNTSALPPQVVDNAQTQTDITTGTGTGTGTTSQTGGGTPPPPFATPGIAGRQTGTGTQTGTAGGSTFSPQFIAGGGGSPNVNVLGNQLVTVVDEKGQKKQVLQDLIEIGGTGFDDEVLARKLRRQAAMPDLKNEDYYPNEPFSQAQTAWGDPIFSGAGALFPMAAYDAQRKARAQAEIDEAKRDVMQIKIPEIKTGAYVGRFRTDYIDAVTGLTDEYVKKYGSSQKAIRAMRQDGSLAKLQSQYEGIARSIDQTADRAKEFLKNAQEKSTTMYFSPEGVRAATNFMNGMGAYADGLISAEQLNQLEQQFRTAERWDNYKERNMKLLTADEKIPTAEQMNAQPSQEDMASYQEQLKLPNATEDYQTWIFVKKYSDLNKQKVLDGIVLPFFSQTPTAMEQLANENETPEQTANRIADSIVALRGRQIEVGQREKNPRGSSNITVYGSGAPSKGTGIYHNTAVAKPKIKQYLSDNHMAVKEGKVSAKQALKQAYLIADASGSWQPDNEYMRVRIPGKWATIQQEVTPMPYSQMYVPTKDGGFAPYDPKVATGNPNAGSAAQPSHTIIIDTERAWMIPSGNGYKMVSQKEYEDLGMPEGAESYRIDKVNAYRSEAELTQSGGMKDPQTGIWVIPPGVVKSGTRNLGKIAYQIYPESPEGVIDQDDKANRAFNAQSFGGRAPKSITVNVTNQAQEDFD